MLNKRTVLVAALLVTLFSTPALACKGSACENLQQSSNNGCLLLTNSGGKKIQVVWIDTIAKYTVKLNPGQSKSPKNVVGTCTTVTVNLNASYF